MVNKITYYPTAASYFFHYPLFLHYSKHNLYSC